MKTLQRFSFALVGLEIFVKSAVGATHTVRIENIAFLPKQLVVAAGDTVEFINDSKAAHTVTADPKLAANPQNILLPKGAEPFHSGKLAPGQSFSLVLTVQGAYKYVCLPHEKHGMGGEITVR